MSRLTRAITGKQSAIEPTEYIEDYFYSGSYTGSGGTDTIVFNNYNGSNVDLSTYDGLMWIKGDRHYLIDTLNKGGTGVGNYLDTSSSARLTSPGANQGVSFLNVGAGGGGGAANIGPFSEINTNGTHYDFWVFRVKPRFFDIVNYTGSSSPQSIAHNLQCEPGMILIKNKSNPNNLNFSWACYHRSMGHTKWHKYEKLTEAFISADDGSGGSIWNNTAPTSTHFTVGVHGGGQGSANTHSADSSNASSYKYVAYLFAHDESANSFIQTGSYEGVNAGGNGSGNRGTHISVGWQPSFVMVKNADGTGAWNTNNDARWFVMSDQKPSGSYGFNIPYLTHATQGVLSGTNGSNGAGKYIPMNDIGTSTSNRVTFHQMPDGFKLVDDASVISDTNQTHRSFNNDGDTYVYTAIRTNPMKPARSHTDAYVGANGNQSAYNPRLVAGFPPDIAMVTTPNSNTRTMEIARRICPDAYYPRWHQQVRMEKSYNHDFFKEGFYSSTLLNSPRTDGDMIREFPKFAHSGYYYGNGGTKHVKHNLGVEPEMIWVNSYSQSGYTGLVIYCKAAGPGDPAGRFSAMTAEHRYTYGWSDYRWSDYYQAWADLYPNKNTFSVGQDTGMGGGGINADGKVYMYTVFASYPNICKIGNYSGSANDITIDCGFSSSARFVLIRNYDNSGTGGANYGTWLLFTSNRGLTTGVDAYDELSNPSSWQNYTGNVISPHSSGFIVKGNDGTVRAAEEGSTHNTSNDMNDGYTTSRYMYMALR